LAATVVDQQPGVAHVVAHAAGEVRHRFAVADVDLDGVHVGPGVAQ